MDVRSRTDLAPEETRIVNARVPGGFDFLEGDPPVRFAGGKVNPLSLRRSDTNRFADGS